MTAPLSVLECEGSVARLRLNRPERHNSLVPGLLASLEENIAAIMRDAAIRVLVLEAAGRSFSTGGDVAGFFDTPRDRRRAYAEAVVGSLNRVILGLLDLPCPIIGRIHGPVTGGSLGLMLACDLVAVAPQAFVQPYYTEVGFSPDGGWTALLPDRIGDAKVREIQLLNRRVPAEELVVLGLANALVPEDMLDATIAGWCDALASKQPGAIAATRLLLRPTAESGRIAAGLETEKQAFMAQIDSEEAHRGMARFLGRTP